MALAVALSVGLAGCGDDDSHEPVVDVSSTLGVDTQQRELDELRDQLDELRREQRRREIEERSEEKARTVCGLQEWVTGRDLPCDS